MTPTEYDLLKQRITRIEQQNQNLLFEIEQAVTLVGHLAQAIEISHFSPEIRSQLSRIKFLRTNVRQLL